MWSDQPGRSSAGRCDAHDVAGRHPDVESPETFWAGLVEPELPALPRITGETMEEAALRYTLYGAITLIVLIIVLIVRRSLASVRGITPA